MSWSRRRAPRGRGAAARRCRVGSAAARTTSTPRRAPAAARRARAPRVRRRADRTSCRATRRAPRSRARPPPARLRRERCDPAAAPPPAATATRSMRPMPLASSASPVSSTGDVDRDTRRQSRAAPPPSSPPRTASSGAGPGARSASATGTSALDHCSDTSTRAAKTMSATRAVPCRPATAGSTPGSRSSTESSVACTAATLSGSSSTLQRSPVAMARMSIGRPPPRTSTRSSRTSAQGTATLVLAPASSAPTVVASGGTPERWRTRSGSITMAAGLVPRTTIGNSTACGVGPGGLADRPDAPREARVRRVSLVCRRPAPRQLARLVQLDEALHDCVGVPAELDRADDRSAIPARGSRGSVRRATRGRGPARRRRATPPTTPAGCGRMAPRRQTARSARWLVTCHRRSRARVKSSRCETSCASTAAFSSSSRRPSSGSVKSTCEPASDGSASALATLDPGGPARHKPGRCGRRAASSTRRKPAGHAARSSGCAPTNQSSDRA